MSKTAAFLELLRRDGIVRGPNTRFTPLSGGVSGEIYLVEDGAERFALKVSCPGARYSSAVKFSREYSRPATF
jgi:hypothetical protein